MKIYSIFTSIFLGLIVSNAYAFSSIHIDFPQGHPEKVQIENKTSIGKCTAPSSSVNCHTNFVNFIVPVVAADGKHVVEEYLQEFSNEYRNLLVNNPFDKPNNYMKFTIPGQTNVCYVDLLNSKPDIFVHLNKDGSCSL